VAEGGVRLERRLFRFWAKTLAASVSSRNAETIDMCTRKGRREKGSAFIHKIDQNCPNDKTRYSRKLALLAVSNSGNCAPLHETIPRPEASWEHERSAAGGFAFLVLRAARFGCEL
jgi:hypothetical protein